MNITKYNNPYDLLRELESYLCFNTHPSQENISEIKESIRDMLSRERNQWPPMRTDIIHELNSIRETLELERIVKMSKSKKRD